MIDEITQCVEMALRLLSRFDQPGYTTLDQVATTVADCKVQSPSVSTIYSGALGTYTKLPVVVSGSLDKFMAGTTSMCAFQSAIAIWLAYIVTGGTQYIPLAMNQCWSTAPSCKRGRSSACLLFSLRRSQWHAPLPRIVSPGRVGVPRMICAQSPSW